MNEMSTVVLTRPPTQQVTFLCKVAKVLVLIAKLRDINRHVGLDGAILTISSLVFTFQGEV